MFWHLERDLGGMWCTTMIHFAVEILRWPIKIRNRFVVATSCFYHMLNDCQARAGSIDKSGKKGGFKGFFGGKKGVKT